MAEPAGSVRAGNAFRFVKNSAPGPEATARPGPGASPIGDGEYPGTAAGDQGTRRKTALSASRGCASSAARRIYLAETAGGVETPVVRCGRKAGELPPPIQGGDSGGAPGPQR